MNFKVDNGRNFISIGYSSIGSYLKVKKPVSLIWSDCQGSIAQYLCLMPCSEATRNELHSTITNSIYKDFTGRIEELHQNLQPLFGLLENGDYQLGYNNGSERPFTTHGSGFTERTYERGWFIQYPKLVDLNRTIELRRKYKEDRRIRGLESFREDLVGFTSTWIYDTWEYDMYIATRPISEIDSERVKFFEEQISAGERPFAILMNAFYQPTHEYSGYFVLDGHHKLQAYEKLSIDPPYAVIFRNFFTTKEPEFDLGSLTEQLYPWQIQHILNNWDDED